MAVASKETRWVHGEDVPRSLRAGTHFLDEPENTRTSCRSCGGWSRPFIRCRLAAVQRTGSCCICRWYLSSGNCLMLAALLKSAQMTSERACLSAGSCCRPSTLSVCTSDPRLQVERNRKSSGSYSVPHAAVISKSRALIWQGECLSW